MLSIDSEQSDAAKNQTMFNSPMYHQKNIYSWSNTLLKLSTPNGQLSNSSSVSNFNSLNSLLSQLFNSNIGNKILDTQNNDCSSNQNLLKNDDDLKSDFENNDTNSGNNCNEDSATKDDLQNTSLDDDTDDLNNKACEYKPFKIKLNLTTMKIPYGEVPGRLSLLSNPKKYTVTVGEVYRRITIPECLNASFLGGILRKAKNKNGGNDLRSRLEDFGMKLPAGRRKSTPCTSFTSLSEGEAMEISNELSLLVKEHFPMRHFSLLLEKKMCPTNDSKSKTLALQKIKDFLKILNAFQFCLELAEREELQLTTPISTSTQTKTEIIENSLLRFSRLTHRFGNKAMMVGWNTFKEMLLLSKNRLENDLRESGLGLQTAKKLC